ncbi:hypothetical protein GOC91_24600 [Sinorhizobium medicae]|jgi:hypothetical protein|uniref:Uncharacterized protein n=1 Tax=Sinorhizobium medicae TaxID=110321 RepID=A0A6G1WSS1_9HYPH|nr:hypothetical protein [Sinorhizobium medicae]MBO1940364.1 hypothetical protein [Sinorhizobium medicae]MDX0431047.1 hypothetical protein [Sinorhizobium medicae]MDX0442412.1 hypothetical protein [Sinorhizobium medicae]MDX0461845.1 hypothetical protein [Sinorhizobium medicae]MDX0485376.1 hypothetical protein [Sinorhizobium medicae]
MANLIKELVSGVVDSALKEILKKTRTTATKRTRRRNRKTASDGGILADIVEAAFRKPAKKQVSRRRTAASRNKLRRRAKS